MPTRSEFEAAAEKFTTAAGLINQLASSATGTGAAQILRGGSLGRLVPERIAAAAASAAQCEQAVMAKAELCWQRAGIIADYQAQLDMFEAAKENYRLVAQQYSADFNAWFLDTTGSVPKPPPPPTAPIRPDPPSESWFEAG